MLASLRIRAAKANAASKRALSGGSAADWHRWRRRARRLSHQYRALGGRAAPRPEFTEQHTTLAVVLGEAQDYGLLLDHCDARSSFAESDRKALQALAKSGARRVCAHRQDRRATGQQWMLTWRVSECCLAPTGNLNRPAVSTGVDRTVRARAAVPAPAAAANAAAWRALEPADRLRELPPARPPPCRGAPSRDRP